jgi:hypothetical protein
MSYQIPVHILMRYDEMLEKETDQVLCEPEPGTSYPHLRWMLGQLSLGRFPEGKACRWLGFIQGIMIERGLTTVQTERDFTRPYFTQIEKQ